MNPFPLQEGSLVLNTEGQLQSHRPIAPTLGHTMSYKLKWSSWLLIQSQLFHI